MKGVLGYFMGINSMIIYIRLDSIQCHDVIFFSLELKTLIVLLMSREQWICSQLLTTIFSTSFTGLRQQCSIGREKKSTSWSLVFGLKRSNPNPRIWTVTTTRWINPLFSSSQWSPSPIQLHPHPAIYIIHQLWRKLSTERTFTCHSGTIHCYS